MRISAETCPKSAWIVLSSNSMFALTIPTLKGLEQKIFFLFQASFYNSLFAKKGYWYLKKDIPIEGNEIESLWELFNYIC